MKSKHLGLLFAGLFALGAGAGTASASAAGDACRAQCTATYQDCMDVAHRQAACEPALLTCRHACPL